MCVCMRVVTAHEGSRIAEDSATFDIHLHKYTLTHLNSSFLLCVSFGCANDNNRSRDKYTGWGFGCDTLKSRLGSCVRRTGYTDKLVGGCVYVMWVWQYCK